MGSVTKKKFEDIKVYCLLCQEFLLESELSPHSVCERNGQFIFKDENNPTWNRILKEQAKWLL